MTPKELVAEFLKLQRAYAFNKRVLVTPERYANAFTTEATHTPDLADTTLHEPLMEHVGHLPVLASYFYPHVEHSSQIDIGRVLTMLSIHDIGETATGDVFAYHKTSNQADAERAAARSLLHPSLHPYLEEYIAKETLDAKYAKAIDVLAPNIYGVIIPKVTLARAESLQTTPQDVIEQSRAHMEWDAVLVSIFDLVLEQYQAIIDGRKPPFPVETYDTL